MAARYVKLTATYRAWCGSDFVVSSMTYFSMSMAKTWRLFDVKITYNRLRIVPEGLKSYQNHCNKTSGRLR